MPLSYEAYSEAVLPMVLSHAGHPVVGARFPAYMLTGESEEASWHAVILVRYRSRRDFIAMVTSPEYADIADERRGGLAYAEVTPTKPMFSLATPRLIVFIIMLMAAMLVDILLRRRAY